MSRIDSIDHLRRHYGTPKERSLGKEIDHLDRHCRKFIALSPFLTIASQGADGRADSSPRGESPGFVAILDDRHLAIPDRPGNNRLDTLSNIVENPAVGILFMIPGFREILRVNGRAEIRDDDELRRRFEVGGKLPATVIVVEVESAYIHCAKAVMRSRLWEDEAKTPRELLPSLTEIIAEQMGREPVAESEEDMLAGYRKVLY
jgi:hypothetical protein